MPKDENRPATVQDVTRTVTEIVGDAAEQILKGVDRLLKDYATREDLARIEQKVDHISADVAHLNDEVKGLVAELSDTPSRREFEELKAREQRFHPTS
ncbi:MAG: hypothetical protein M5R40_16925 [Anaerolineae bacterium]|nr:hypothetical protein [Anaerolineae bacterium]